MTLSNTPRVSRRPACLGTLLYQRPFQFRQYPDHLPHRPTCRRGRVNGLRDRPESHAPRFQIIEQADKIMQRAAQTIKLPDYQYIPGLESLETLRQFWPLDMRTGCLVGEYLAAARLL